DRDTLRLVNLLPAAVLLVLADGDDDRAIGVVDLRGDLSPQSAFEGALEVAQRFRPRLADAGVLVAGRNDVLFATRLDAGQGQLLADDGGQLLHRQFDFEDVPARLIAGAAVFALARGQRRARIAFALADAAGAFLTVTELRNDDLRQRNADEVLPLFADHFA